MKHWHRLTAKLGRYARSLMPFALDFDYANSRLRPSLILDMLNGGSPANVDGVWKIPSPTKISVESNLPYPSFR